jgi:branched-subunit amino acid ABC-type transport system permease component
VSLQRYSILVALVAAATLPVAALVLPSGTQLPAIAFGALLAMLNTLAAHALVLWSERRSTKVFLGAVLGGMAGRMALMLAAFVVGVLGLGLPRLPLVASLLGYFMLFLVLELTLQHRHAGRVPATR